MIVPIKARADSPARVAPTMSPVFRGDSEAFASSAVVLGLEPAVYVGLKDTRGSVVDVLVYAGALTESLQ